jgi:hypothetical protein
MLFRPPPLLSLLSPGRARSLNITRQALQTSAPPSALANLLFHPTPSNPSSPHPAPPKIKVWEKLTNYMEIEPRWVANRPGVYVAANEDLIAACDENTIGARGRRRLRWLQQLVPTAAAAVSLN